MCDIDGVVLAARQSVPGAGEALRRIAAGGREILFITNNSTKTRQTVAERIDRIVGYSTEPESILTSGQATGVFVRDHVSQVYVVGSDGLRATLRDAGVQATPNWREADAVVVGLDFEVTYEKLKEATLAVQGGARLYATGSDVSYPGTEGLYPGTGALVSVIEKATGTCAIACGKPNPPMRRLVEDFVAGPAVMVGDRPETDVALGKAEGWATVLVLTGVTKSALDVDPAYAPDLVLDSIRDLPACLGL